MTTLGLLVATLAGLSGPARAQEPMKFELDTVLVVPFDFDDTLLRPEAERLQEQMERELQDHHLIVPLSQVENFDEDLDAMTYMLACPDGNHIGCAFVVGQRGQADWVVTGQISDDLDGGLAVNTSIIDVSESEAVLNFGVTLTDDNEELFFTAVADVINKVIAGAADDVDVRGVRDGSEDEQRVMERAQDELIASSLTELEEAMGSVIRTESRTLAPPKLTRDDLDAMATREDGAPWEDLDMSRAEYARFRSSGVPLDEWRIRAHGRGGQIVARLGFGGGAGPYSQSYDGRYVLSDSDLSVVQVHQFQEVAGGGSLGMDFEVGVGLMRYLEVTALIGLRTGRFDYLINRSVQNDDSDVPSTEPESQPYSSTVFGARATVVPMPSYPVRPTATVGFAYWSGSRVTSIVAPPGPLLVDEACNASDSIPLGSQSLALVQMAPGAEISAGRTVNIFGRMFLDIPLAGNRSQLASCGAAVLDSPPQPTGSSPVGISAQAGIELRFGPFGKAQKKGGYLPGDMYYDEDAEY